MTESASFAVAICTWNRAALLRQTLERLAQISWPVAATELIVIDNGSTDDTASVAEGFSGQLPIRVVRETSPGLSNARNRAIKEARESHVLFTDDDVLVGDRWLHAFESAIQDYPDAGAFGGPIEPWFPQPPSPSLVKAFPMLAIGFCGLDHHREEGVLPAPFDIYGANMGFRLAALDQKLFDPLMGPVRGSSVTSEETALVDRLRESGKNVVWVPEMSLKHYVDPRRMTLPYLLRFSHEVAMGEVMRKGVPEGAAIAGVPRWVLRTVATQAARAVWYGLSGNRVLALSSLRLSSHFSGIARQSYRNARTRRVTA